MITRRELGLGAVALGAAACLRYAMSGARAATGNFEVTHTPEEWKRLLTPMQYYILREQGTETPFTSPLLHEKRDGVFTCAGCGLPLFSSKTKFDSGTGWPSFWAPIKGHVDQGRDSSLGMEREEVHCHRCGGHLGHVFNDGPPPTGLRYCIDGYGLKFAPGGTA
jgi:peptide-methionine (R)-S-oxide reductase